MSEAENRPTEVPGVRETANRLRMAIGAFKRRIQEVTTVDELTNPQLTALSRLDRLGPMTISDLARREQITPQAMGATIASLEELGMVSRSPDATDRRRLTLYLTPDGEAAVHSGRNSVVDKVTAVLQDSFTEADIETLSAAAPLIERLAERL
ncbi:MarR family winged helix-turn-helix transcriptional regulator [Streptomyces sp. enrichment culture]|uniref:MarR family winged helix-turn-helix transcriptional regulator n=1 Tax=Streptomyces sp. enrichment culture TaxID=1795815 RepID=UPI003F57BF5B